MKRINDVTISFLAVLILLGISKVTPVAGQIPYFPISDIPWNKNVPDAAAYAPVTILVDERADGVHISYDRMASLLAQGRPEKLWGSPERTTPPDAPKVRSALSSRPGVRA